MSIIREVDDQLITVSDGDEDPDEDVTILKSIIKCHRIFNKRYEDIIQRLFGMDYDFYKRMVHDQTVEKSIAGSHFQRSDIMRMLSEQFVRDNSLDMYMEVLKQKFIDERKSGWKKMFFVPAAYYNLLTHEGTKGKYKSTAFRFVRNIDQYEYFVWPVNIGNYHWALVYHALTSGSPFSI